MTIALPSPLSVHHPQSLSAYFETAPETTAVPVLHVSQTSLIAEIFYGVSSSRKFKRSLAPSSIAPPSDSAAAAPRGALGDDGNRHEEPSDACGVPQSPPVRQFCSIMHPLWFPISFLPFSRTDRSSVSPIEVFVVCHTERFAHASHRYLWTISPQPGFRSPPPSCSVAAHLRKALPLLLQSPPQARMPPDTWAIVLHTFHPHIPHISVCMKQPCT